MPSMYQRIALLLVFLTPKSGCVVAEKACFYCTVSVVLFGVKPHSGAAHPLHQACCGSCASALRLDVLTLRRTPLTPLRRTGS